MSDNIPAIKTYENSGFVREGVMRDEYRRFDGYVDIVMMSILEQEWEARKYENILATNNVG
jgi:RimJ/RimL family protein N-acetyltransferase